MTTEAKERPILFSGVMVRALLAGRKTQTRRVVKPQPHEDPTWNGGAAIQSKTGKLAVGSVPYYQGVLRNYCPYGQPGDRLWVRETFQPLWVNDHPGDYKTGEGYRINYVATDGIAEFADPETEELSNRCWPSIFMPRWASRLTLEIVSVRVERLQDISEFDAIKEGVAPCDHNGFCTDDHTCSYKSLWNTLNAARGFGWDVNPWVWVLEFKQLSREGAKEAK